MIRCWVPLTIKIISKKAKIKLIKGPAKMTKDLWKSLASSNATLLFSFITWENATKPPNGMAIKQKSVPFIFFLSNTLPKPIEKLSTSILKNLATQ